MRISYAYEKLNMAVYALVVGQGDVRSRLLNAYSQIHVLKKADFPLELQLDWAWINQQINKYGPLYKSNNKLWKGSAENTLGRIKNSTGSKIALKIYELKNKIRNIHYNTH